MATIDYQEAISPITDTDRGAVNTITCVILIVTSIIISLTRFIISQRRAVGLGKDDVLFGIALVCIFADVLRVLWIVLIIKQILTIITSIVSQRMVNVGLGEHQDTLSTGTVDSFYKVR